MPQEWLNRAGLILDFASGFLMAPEIIGKRRLMMLEESIEHALLSLTETLKEVEELYRDWRGDPYHIPWPRRFPLIGRLINKRLGKKHYPASRLHIVVSLLTALVTFVVADKIFVRLLGSNLVVDLFVPRYSVSYSLADVLIYVGLAFAWTVFGIYASYALEYWLLWFGRLLVAKLRGEDRFREILLALGLMLFVVGFLLQFLATF